MYHCNHLHTLIKKQPPTHFNNHFRFSRFTFDHQLLYYETILKDESNHILFAIFELMKYYNLQQ